METNDDYIKNLRLEAQVELDNNKMMLLKLTAEREKIIKFYIKRLNKVQKRIKWTNNAIKREEYRINECKKMLGIPVDVIKKEKVFKKDVIDSIEKFAINPVTGEVIELSYDEITQLIENKK